MKSNRITKRVGEALTAAGTAFTLAFFLSACLPGAGGVAGSAGSSSLASVGDYGDAPDQRDDGTARFPTKASNNGARHLDTTRSALGYLLSDGSLPVSAEVDATDPADPDGEPNLGDPLTAPYFFEADRDRYDDGFMIGLLPPGTLYDLPVVVSVASSAEEKARYINILADWNGDLEWNGADDNGAPEWVIQNYEIHVAPGASERVFLPTAMMGHQMYEIWFRVTLSETPVVAGSGGWDGTGEFQEGETEDYIFHTLPQDEIIVDDPGNPPPPPLPPDDGDGDDDAGDDDGQDDNGDPGNGGFDPDDPDNDGQPGVDPANAKKLRRLAANVYSLTLCKGQTWRRGFEWETQVRNGTTSNPFTATVGWSTDPGSVTIHAVDVGYSRVSFEANTISFPVEEVEWVTGVIHVTVINCENGEPVGDGGSADDDDGDDNDDDGADEEDPWDGIDNAGPEDAGKLVHAEGNVYYLVLCCTDIYQRGFQYETRVYNPTSSDPGVATLGVSNDPGTITITPTGHGTTTLTFEADPATFPYDNNERVTVTIHVKVIDCTELGMAQ